MTLGGNRTINTISNAVDGATYYLWVVQDGTGGRTLTFGSNFNFAGGTAPDLSGRSASDEDFFSILCLEASTPKFLCVAIQDFS